MMRRFLAALLSLATIVALAPRGASAQTSAPAYEGGYAGKGDLVVQSAVAGAPVGVGGRIAFEESGSLFRLDVLSLAIPGTDSAISSVLATQLFPQGGFSVVFDRRNSTYTIWSAAKHAYYSHGIQRDAKSPAPDATPTPIATPGAGTTGPDFFSAFKALRSLKDDKTFSMSIALTGHSTLFGHAVSTLQYQYAQTPLVSGGSTGDVHGEIDFADDFDEVPIRFTASAALKGIPPSSMRLELTELAKAAPPLGDFQPPRDYTRANSIGDVLGGSVHF
jgi:hypothetical protein